MLKGLDIWLTTDPNDCPDWGEMGARCPNCDCDALEYVKDNEKDNSVVLSCDECYLEFDFELEEPNNDPYEPNCKECGDMDITCEHCG